MKTFPMPAKPCEWKVGRRVRMRGDTIKGTILEERGGLTVLVHFDVDSMNTEVLIETLKLLKPRTPKPAARAREWKIWQESDDGDVIQGPPITRGTQVKVREIIPGEVYLSREKLLEAWEDNPLTQGEEIFFEMFMKSIGLKESAE